MTASPLLRAEFLFDKCEDVLSENDLRKLDKYIQDNDKLSHYICQRLDNDNFLYSDDVNLYSCHETSEQSLLCEDAESGALFPDLSVSRIFSGKNGKRFALLKVDQLSQGVYGEGYLAFYFVPKNLNPKGYEIFSFKGAGAWNGAYSDEGKTCSNMDVNAKAITPLSKPYKIVNEGQPQGHRIRMS